VSPEGGERRREVVCRPYGFEDVLVDGWIPAWDRFRFEISLEKYESSIQQRTMWFVGRYSTASPTDAGSSMIPVVDTEWWDNNSGNNYRVAFAKRLSRFGRGGEREEAEERDKFLGIGGMLFSARLVSVYFWFWNISLYIVYQLCLRHRNPSLPHLKFPLHFLILLV
jgi:hypothetical protein